VLQRSPAIDGSPCAGSSDPVDRLAVDAVALLPLLLSQVAMLAGVMATVCGAVLLLRRLAGAIEAPPGPEAVLATCGAGLLLVAIGDLAWRPSAARASNSAMSWLPAVLARLGLLMAVAAVGLPLRLAPAVDALTTIAVLLVSLVAVARGPVAGLISTRLVRRRPAKTNGRLDVPTAVGSPQTTVPVIAPALTTAPDQIQGHAQDHILEWDTPSPLAGSLLQRFERIALPEGFECVRGRLCVVVPEGSRSGYAHVGFCPPLAAMPTVDVTTDYDGVEAVVSAAEVLPWGVRVECRLDEPAEETIEIPVDILAKSPV
jgi:hypothetical protein